MLLGLGRAGRFRDADLGHSGYGRPAEAAAKRSASLGQSRSRRADRSVSRRREAAGRRYGNRWASWRLEINHQPAVRLAWWRAKLRALMERARRKSVHGRVGAGFEPRAVSSRLGQVPVRFPSKRAKALSRRKGLTTRTTVTAGQNNYYDILVPRSMVP